MNILLVGSQKIWALENIYKRYLCELGHMSEIFPIHDLFYDYYYRRKTNKILFKLGLSGLYSKINKELIGYVKKNHFDVIWVFKGMELFPDTISHLKKSDLKIVNFNPDNPFLLSGAGSGNKNVLDSIDRYDLHLCYHRSVMQRILEDYNVPCEVFPFGYDQTNPYVLNKEDEIRKACFIGNPDKKRIEVLQKLIDNQIPVEVYGNDWNKYLSLNKFSKVYPAVYQDDFKNIAPKYRVQINILRDHNEGSHNMRTFDMPGLGCIMVATESDDHNLYFKDGEEAFFYKSVDELGNIIKRILDLPWRDAEKLRKNAINRCKKDRYSYQERTKDVIKIFQESFKMKEKL